MKNIINKKGQALAELAVFSAIFLYVLSVFIQYGLSANFIQEGQMKTFRRALGQAKSVSQHSRTVSIVTLDDRQYPDARDAFGIAERNPISAQASVNWTNALQGQYEYSTNPYDDDLPRVTYAINGRDIIKTTGVFKRIPKGTWCSYRQDCGNTCSYLQQCNVRPQELPPCTPTCSTSSIRFRSYGNGSSYGEPIVMYGWTNSHGVGGSDWQPRPIGDWINAEADAADGYYYQRVLYLVNKYADVDGDGKDELIIAQHETVENRWDSDTKQRVYVSGIDYLDFQDGEIDLTITDKDVQNGKSKQGLASDSVKTLAVNDGTSLTREENTQNAPDSIVTTTDIDAQENTTYYLGTNAGKESVENPFPTQTTVVWDTPNN